MYVHYGRAMPSLYRVYRLSATALSTCRVVQLCIMYFKLRKVLLCMHQNSHYWCTIRVLIVGMVPTYFDGHIPNDTLQVAKILY